MGGKSKIYTWNIRKTSQSIGESVWVCPKKSQLPGITFEVSLVFSAWMVCFWEGQNISFVEEVFGGQLPSEVEHLKIPWKKWWLKGTTISIRLSSGPNSAFSEFAKWQAFLQGTKIDSSSMLECPPTHDASIGTFTTSRWWFQVFCRWFPSTLDPYGE